MKRAAVIVVVFALALFAGCGKKVESTKLLSNGAVTSIEVMSIDGDKIRPSEEGVKEILHIIEHAEPTRSQSVNDQPTNVDAYGTIIINTDEESTTFHYYEKGGAYYIEQPYVGIYRLDSNPEAVMLLPAEENSN